MAGTQYFAKPGDTAPIPRVTAPGQPQAASPWPARLLQAGGLVVIAVVASLLWWLIRQDGGTASGQPEAVQPGPLTSGEFDYTVAAGPVNGTDCADHAYGKIKSWFAGHPCERLARALYITETGGARALVSVSLVTMPSSKQAAELHGLAYTSGTGNVADLAREGAADIPNAPKVAGGQYRSTLAGPNLTIVEAKFFGGHKDKQLLGRIADDARRLTELLQPR